MDTPPYSVNTPPPIPQADGLTARRPGGLRLQVLSPEELEAYKNLLLFAKAKVEGTYAGRHASPFRGASSEFSDFKAYTPGDEVAQVDWRAYGRTRRLYLKQHEDETDMVLYLMLDTSASMEYAGQGRPLKLHLAAKVAAALAYLMHRQGDKSALALFAHQVTRMIPVGRTRRHMNTLIGALEEVRGAYTTGMATALEQCASVFRRRGNLIILSDFHTDLPAMFEQLSRFQHREFGVLLLQILDPDEWRLPSRQVARYVDMENGEDVRVDPSEIREVYARRFRAVQDSLARESESRQIQCTTLDTRDPYTHALESYLGFRDRRSL